MIGCVLVMDVLNKTPGSSTQINITVESRSIFEAPNDITMRNITSITGSCSGGNKLQLFFSFFGLFSYLNFQFTHILLTALNFGEAYCNNSLFLFEGHFNVG